MEISSEYGPTGPKSELERLTEALMKALTKKYSELEEEVAATCIIGDNPAVVKISLRISVTKPSEDTTLILNHFHEDIQELLENYGVTTGDYNIEFKSVGEHEHTVIIKSLT